MTTVGLVLYGSLRLDYFLFYRPLGVTPEEVGHGYASTLAQALVGGLLILLMLSYVLVGVGFVAVPAAAAGRVVFGRGLRQMLGWLVATLAVSFPVGWLVRLPWIAPEVSREARWFGVAIVVWVAVGFVHDDGQMRRLVPALLRRVAFPVTLGSVLFVVLVVMPATAYYDAKAVAQGTARDAQFAGILGFPWGADVVTMTWLDGETTPSFAADDCFMYLGRSDGIAVLWSPGREEIHRVPVGRITISSPDTASCDVVEQR